MGGRVDGIVGGRLEFELCERRRGHVRNRVEGGRRHPPGASKRTTTVGSGQVVSTGGAKTSSKHSKAGPPAPVRADSAVSAQTTSSTAGEANNSGSQSGSGGSADVVAPSANSTAAAVTPTASLAPKLPVLPSPSAISGVVTTALHDVLDPFSGGLPTPAVDSPLALTFAALQRRTTASALASNPIAINPVLVINNGIIDGTTNATGGRPDSPTR